MIHCAQHGLLTFQPKHNFCCISVLTDHYEWLSQRFFDIVPLHLSDHALHFIHKLSNLYVTDSINVLMSFLSLSQILTELKSDNQRLKDENGALIRVISKLSKWKDVWPSRLVFVDTPTPIWRMNESRWPCSSPSYERFLQKQVPVGTCVDPKKLFSFMTVTLCDVELYNSRFYLIRYRLLNTFYNFSLGTSCTVK